MPIFDRVLYAAVVTLSACATASPPVSPRPQYAQPIGSSAPAPASPVLLPAAPARVTVNDLYPVEAAVADVLSGPLVFIGLVGENAHIECAYRNDRIVIIDQYCRGFPIAFGVTILSPIRGRVQIFAEARAPIAKLKRAAYVVFSAESEGPNTVIAPPLSLEMTFEALRAYDRARAFRNLPGCVSKVYGEQIRETCSKTLDVREFIARDGGFVQNPPESWYELVRRIDDERRKDHVRISDATRAAIGRQYAFAHGIVMHTSPERLAITDGIAGPISATDDGGLVVVGTKSTAPDGKFVGGASIPVAVRLDSRGKKVWERTLKHQRFIDFEAVSVVSVRDGFVVYVLSYVDPGQGAVARLVKLDPQGKPQWEWIGRGNGYFNTVYVDNIERMPNETLHLKGHIQPEKGGKLFHWTGEVDREGKLLLDEVGGLHDSPGK